MLQWWLEFYPPVAATLSILSTVLGVAVALIAFRAYRQSRSRPMLFVAVGFVLVFWVPLLLVVGWLLNPRAEILLGMLGELSRVIGLACVLYGLWAPGDAAAPRER